MTLTNSPGRSPSNAPGDASAGVGAAGHLEVRDSRSGRAYEIPIEHEAIRARRAGSCQGRRCRSRAAQLRPGVPEHRVLPERDHVYRRRPGDPPVPRLPDRGARGRPVVPRRGVLARPRRAADGRGVAGVRRGGPAGGRPAGGDREARGVVPARRPPDGSAAQRRRRPGGVPGRNRSRSTTRRS